MLFALLPTAEDIEQWADSLLAPEDLPRLVRKLIVATTEPTHLDIGAGKAVRFPGWDGEVAVGSGTAWVPVGRSNWEMGTGPAGDKAGRD